VYIPPKDECEKGGYESVCRVTAVGEEKTLGDRAVEEMKRFLSK